MDLVPILSTIILVGTVATFILAVAAYILYKIRERRVLVNGSSYMAVAPEPHVLVSPQPFQTESAPPPVRDQPVAKTDTGNGPSRRGSLFWEYTDEGFVPVRPQSAGASVSAEEELRDGGPGPAWL